jgi:Zn-finger nucleic acid-binding protein
VLLDRCSNHGLWFDRGELAALLSSGGFDPQGKVVQLLKNLFGT